jgi:hypothetical protein
VDVEVQVFSGRANPRFRLSPEHERALTARLATLRLPPTPPPPRRLGYQGFVVFADTPAGGRWPVLHVYGGAVTVLYGPYPRTYRDVAHIEAWLRSLADAAGMGPLLDAQSEDQPWLRVDRGAPDEPA